MRLATVADVPRIEEICNDPRIRVWTACDSSPPCMGKQYVSAPSFSVIGDEGVFLAKCIEPQRYVIHTNLLPEHRGAQAVELAREALNVAFTETDALELLTMVPHTVPHARVLAKQMGFRHLFTRHNVWPIEGVRHAMGFYSLSIDDWIILGACADSGSAFHRRLQEKMHETLHERDYTHDCYVGAAVEMVLSDNAHKAVSVYNRWARFAAYAPVSIVSEQPLRIDIRDCVLRVEGETFFVETHHA